jgi:rhodanese-related sulfurtransferase
MFGYLCSYGSNASLSAYSLYSVGKWYSSSGTQHISAKRAARLIERGSIKNIIDVRSEAEWSEGHYDNAKHIPIPDFNESSLKKNHIKKGDKLILYCNGGRRARYASDILKSMGFNDVFYIESDYHSLPKNIRGEMCIASSSCSQSLTA